MTVAPPGDAPPGPDAPPRDATLQGALRRAMARARGHPVVVPDRVRFEMRRKLLHVVTAIVAVPMLLVLPFLWVLGLAVVGVGVIISTWIVERHRALKALMIPPYEELVHKPLADVLQKTRREGEDFPWSPVLYTVSLILIGLAHEFLGMSWTIAFAAYAILGIGDAASALVGVAYGRRKLPWNRKKSVEGTAAGLVAGFFAAVVMAVLPFAFQGLIMPPLFLGVLLAGATAGALAETVPRVEDNFVVPITSAAVMFVLSMAMGVPLP
jgi:dolichol kinase